MAGSEECNDPEKKLLNVQTGSMSEGTTEFVQEPRLITSQITQQPASRVIAFYLPQYHPIPENDVWWGKGFTDWRNVVAGKPLFPGHYQPHIPADLGFYDLRLTEVRQAQADLAKHYGIHGFCYYHYWFNGRMLLDFPLNEVLASGQPDFPFCICWANQSWTRNWDGKSDHPLIHQVYGGDDDDRAHIRWLMTAFRDERYIKVHGRPLLLIYRVSHLPAPERSFLIWREECLRAGLVEPYIVGVETQGNDLKDMRTGCDAAAEFLPFGIYDLVSPVADVWAKGQAVFSYEALAAAHLERPLPEYTWFPSVVPGWDNSPRRKGIPALIVHGSTPRLYEQWLRGTFTKQESRVPDENIVFVNAWNEWAEGAHLEPDVRYGSAYLESTSLALGHDIGDTIGSVPVPSTVSPRRNRDTSLEAQYKDLLARYMLLQGQMTDRLEFAMQSDVIAEYSEELERHKQVIAQYSEWNRADQEEKEKLRAQLAQYSEWNRADQEEKEKLRAQLAQYSEWS